MLKTDSDIGDILDLIQNGHRLDKKHIKSLLGLSDPEEIDVLFQTARKIRTKYFGEKIFLYGFLYFSTYCRNHCNFCQYRLANVNIPRYRKNEKEIIVAASEIATIGVDLLDLTMGEDPELYSDGESGLSRLVSIVKTVQNTTHLPVMISPGVLPDHILAELAESGVIWYACYQETHNKSLYKLLRQGQSFEERIEKKRFAKHLGLLIEEGILTGVGETLGDIADSIIWMRDFSVDQARVMTFVPQAGTPMAGVVSQNPLKEQIIIAVMRLVLPDLLIPASLDVGGLNGLKARLNAGANVVTSIMVPENGLAGVANHSLDIENSRRTREHILPVLHDCGLKPASPGEYSDWITTRRNAGFLSR